MCSRMCPQSPQCTYRVLEVFQDKAHKHVVETALGKRQIEDVRRLKHDVGEPCLLDGVACCLERDG